MNIRKKTQPDPTRVLSCFDKEVIIVFMNSNRFSNILGIEVFLFYLYFSGRYINNTNANFNSKHAPRSYSNYIANTPE